MKTELCQADDPSFWAYHSWADFSLMEEKESRVVIIPVVGFCDWGHELPLDIEEYLTTYLLSESMRRNGDDGRFLVLPPHRFVLGNEDCFFSLDPDSAHRAMEELAASVKQSGFRKVLFLNSSPSNEDFVDCAGRDLRISLQLQPFCINLSSLGLDFSDPETLTRIATLYREEGSWSDLLPSVQKLNSLLDEVHAFRPLTNDGAIPLKVYP